MNNSTDVNTFMASLHWQASKKLALQLGMAYSIAEMEMEDVWFESESWTDVTADTGAAWFGEYDPANTNEMESYSKLDYTVWDLTLSASYAISNNIGLSVNYVYEDVEDDAASYVYGDEDGNYQSLMTYVTVRF